MKNGSMRGRSEKDSDHRQNEQMTNKMTSSACLPFKQTSAQEIVE